MQIYIIQSTGKIFRSHNEKRVYNQRLYEVEFKNIPKIMNKHDFSINSRHYYWMTISEMEKDDNIMKSRFYSLFLEYF